MTRTDLHRRGGNRVFPRSCWAATGALVLGTLLAGLAGCSTTPTWWKPSKTPEAFARDRWACQRETVVPYTKLVPTTGWTARIRVAHDVEEACLRARGYERAPRGS